MLQPSPGNGVALHRDDGKAHAPESLSQGFSSLSHLYWVLQRKAVTKTLPVPYPASALPFLSGPQLEKPGQPLPSRELMDFVHNP